MVDTSGQIISQSRYLPFGELLWEDGTSPTDYTYTGQRSLSDIGLMDYNARFYDPMLGRFTSPDSIIPDADNVVDFNRYAYVYNNPIINNDPTGHYVPPGVCAIAGGSIPECQRQGGTSGGPMFADPTPVNILFSGGSGEGSAHEPGPTPEEQMGAWVDMYDDTQQYLGSDYYYDEAGIKHYQLPYAKYKTAEAAFSDFSKYQVVNLTCYSGGVEACIMFAEMYIANGGTIHSMALIGGGFVASDAEGVERGNDYWYGRVQALVNPIGPDGELIHRPVNVLVYDDWRYGEKIFQQGDLNVEVTEKGGSYTYVTAERWHWMKAVDGDASSNRSTQTASAVTYWLRSQTFSTSLDPLATVH